MRYSFWATVKVQELVYDQDRVIDDASFTQGLMAASSNRVGCCHPGVGVPKGPSIGVTMRFHDGSFVQARYRCGMLNAALHPMSLNA